MSIDARNSNQRSDQNREMVQSDQHSVLPQGLSQNLSLIQNPFSMASSMSNSLPSGMSSSRQPINYGMEQSHYQETKFKNVFLEEHLSFDQQKREARQNEVADKRNLINNFMRNSGTYKNQSPHVAEDIQANKQVFSVPIQNQYQNPFARGNQHISRLQSSKFPVSQESHRTVRPDRSLFPRSNISTSRAMYSNSLQPRQLDSISQSSHTVKNRPQMSPQPNQSAVYNPLQNSVSRSNRLNHSVAYVKDQPSVSQIQTCFRPNVSENQATNILNNPSHFNDHIKVSRAKSLSEDKTYAFGLSQNRQIQLMNQPFVPRSQNDSQQRVIQNLLQQRSSLRREMEHLKGIIREKNQILDSYTQRLGEMQMKIEKLEEDFRVQMQGSRSIGSQIYSKEDNQLRHDAFQRMQESQDLVSIEYESPSKGLHERSMDTWDPVTVANQTQGLSDRQKCQFMERKIVSLEDEKRQLTKKIHWLNEVINRISNNSQQDSSSLANSASEVQYKITSLDENSKENLFKKELQSKDPQNTNTKKDSQNILNPIQSLQKDYKLLYDQSIERQQEILKEYTELQEDSNRQFLLLMEEIHKYREKVHSRVEMPINIETEYQKAELMYSKGFVKIHDDQFDFEAYESKKKEKAIFEDQIIYELKKENERLRDRYRELKVKFYSKHPHNRDEPETETEVGSVNLFDQNHQLFELFVKSGLIRENSSNKGTSTQRHYQPLNESMMYQNRLKKRPSTANINDGEQNKVSTNDLDQKKDYQGKFRKNSDELKDVYGHRFAQKRIQSKGKRKLTNQEVSISQVTQSIFQSIGRMVSPQSRQKGSNKKQKSHLTQKSRNEQSRSPHNRYKNFISQLKENFGLTSSNISQDSFSKDAN